jgi:WhiB family transcriptional regulator, redox-sensing transcriptional regulator
MAAVTRLPSPTMNHWRWQQLAACRGMELEDFFHPSGERGHRRRAREDRAKRVCAACPVLESCRRWARAVQEPFGVWGGESEDERRAVIRAGQRAARLEACRAGLVVGP